MSTWSQQGPLFVQVLLAPRRLPEPTRLYTFMQSELTGQQARMVTLARPSSISQFPPTDRVSKAAGPLPQCRRTACQPLRSGPAKTVWKQENEPLRRFISLGLTELQ